ncbi:SecD/SecF fusion protein [Paenibacillus catalpae]|uniref:Protein-export membrane protein SecF n=1 Tax=Paenibacillus catalpae TaxID=1045775 RepID=A0A1I1Z0M7_9BACL|nr:protein translocase subunit SecF [Paenibacillus catalpae]SFE25102.1 SecD/SecF fusion protein [Paenibacillus catalpae]
MLYNAKVRFDFIKHRNKFFLFSVILTLVGILSVSIFHMNFGVDFKAGTNMDILVGKKLTQTEAKDVLEQQGYSDITPTVGGTNGDRVSARFDDVLDQSKVKAIEDAFKAKYGDKVSSEVNVVSPDIAQELGIKAIYAVIIASVAIMLYVMIRFEWRMALAANIAILYDAFVVVTIFSIFRLQVDLPFIAAVLTTIGYSINDKIVIFDRIRENLRFAKTKNADQIGDLVNQSLWQTMARNVYTVLAVLIIATCLFIFGSESIKLFALAKMIGLASGAYSSICIAAPLWMVMKSKQKPSTKQVAKKAV